MNMNNCAYVEVIRKQILKLRSGEKNIIGLNNACIERSQGDSIQM